MTLAALLTLFSILLAVLALARPVGTSLSNLVCSCVAARRCDSPLYSFYSLPRCSIWCESAFRLVAL